MYGVNMVKVCVEDRLANKSWFVFPDGAVFSKRKKVFITPFVSKRGYKCVLMHGGAAVNVHRLVASRYCGGKYRHEDLVCDHIDANKLNNNAENLRWMTKEENRIQFFKYQKGDFR